MYLWLFLPKSLFKDASPSPSDRVKKLKIQNVASWKKKALPKTFNFFPRIWSLIFIRYKVMTFKQLLPICKLSLSVFCAFWWAFHTQA